MYPPFPPELFELGPFTLGDYTLGPFILRWYGILIILGVLATTWVASRYVARKGQNPENVWDMLLWVLIPGIIGARLYYVFVQAPNRDAYFQDPSLIFQIWTGGIHIFGGFIAGGLALLAYAWWKKLPVLVYLDAIGLGLPLGQAIGRFGNFINQELYGPPTTLPWGLIIDPQYRIAPYNDLTTFPEDLRFHPLFAYEMLWNLIGFGLIFWISRRFEKQLRRGDIVLMYAIWYPLGRFFIEFLRTDSWFFQGLPIGFNVVHILSAITVIGAAVILYMRHRNYEPGEGGEDAPKRRRRHARAKAA